MDTRRILLLIPVKESICKNLSFKDAIRFRDALFLPSLKCTISISDPDGEIHYLNRVDDKTITIYQIIKKRGSRRFFFKKKYDLWMLKILLDCGFNVNVANKNNTTPLMIAARKKMIDRMQLFLNHGATVNNFDKWSKTNALMDAINEDLVKGVKLLLDAGADLNHRNEFGENVLHVVAELGNLEITKLLVKRGTQINAFDNRRNTPLLNAAINEHWEVVKFLLNCGANIPAESEDNWTVLGTVAEYGNFEILQLLLERGADVRLISPVEMEKIRNSQPEIAELLQHRIKSPQ